MICDVHMKLYAYHRSRWETRYIIPCCIVSDDVRNLTIRQSRMESNVPAKGKDTPQSAQPGWFGS